MADAKYADGPRQPLYFKTGHPQEGQLKGMAVILTAHSLVEQ